MLKLFSGFFALLLLTSCGSFLADLTGDDEYPLTQPEDSAFWEGGDPSIAAIGSDSFDFEKQGALVRDVGDRVFFDFDSHILTQQAQSILTAQAEWLNSYPNVNIIIEGHCDERGTREYNIALGERRANVVKNFVTQLGVNANRISTISFGKERPAVIGEGQEVMSQNRRGVTVITN